MVIVTLLTDFGIRDSYVAQMKAVILENCPDCNIVDISHEVGRHDILEGSFLLETAVPHFSKGTIHVAVVDPGVGSKRFPLVVRCRGAFLIGPDNGVLSRAVDKLGLVAAYRIDKKEFSAEGGSLTFHGRDVFARTAGLLASGRAPEDVGPRVSTLVRLKTSSPSVEPGMLACAALHVDTFGNVITDIPSGGLGKLGLRRGMRLTVHTKNKSLEGRFSNSYHEASRMKLIVLVGSHGYLEVAAREASAAVLLGVNSSDRMIIRWAKPYR